MVHVGTLHVTGWKCRPCSLGLSPRALHVPVRAPSTLELAAGGKALDHTAGSRGAASQRTCGRTCLLSPSLEPAKAAAHPKPPQQLPAPRPAGHGHVPTVQRWPDHRGLLETTDVASRLRRQPGPVSGKPSWSTHISHLHSIVLVIHILQPGNELSRVETVSDRFVFVSLGQRQQKERHGGLFYAYSKQSWVKQATSKPL